MRTKKTPSKKSQRTRIPEELRASPGVPALDGNGCVSVGPGVSAYPCERARKRPREAEALCPDLWNGLGTRWAPALRGQGEDPAGRREKSPLGTLFQSHRRIRPAVARRQGRLYRLGGRQGL